MADSEDIEYHITFPSPPPEESKESLDDIADVDEAGDDEPLRREPVVILLGWLGCDDKHLTKYGQIYQQKGCITIRYTAPKDVVIFNVAKARPIAEKILDLLLDYSLEENPVFFHVFSNGGGVIYRFISDALQDGSRPYSQIQMHGCIFDSLPGKRRIHKAAQAFISNINANIFIRYAIGLCLMIYLIIMRLYLAIFSRGKKWDQFSYFQDMKEDKLCCPQLFLYSTGDKLVPYTDITEIIDFRRSLGVNVQSVQWDDSDHVAHLRKHREAYINACHQFVDDCIKLQQRI